MPSRFRLQVDIVPRPLWGVNLRSNIDGLGRNRWEKVRQQAIEACGGKCTVCGSGEKLRGHEVWKYEEKKTVGRAILRRVDALCWTLSQHHALGQHGPPHRLISLSGTNGWVPVP